MSNTIKITSKAGKVWNIHRSAVDRLSLKSELELEAFFKRFFAWFDPWEEDVLVSLIRMERAGLTIDNEINLKYNR